MIKNEPSLDLDNHNMEFYLFHENIKLGYYLDINYNKYKCRKIETEVKEKSNTKLIVESVKNIIVDGKQ